MARMAPKKETLPPGVVPSLRAIANASGLSNKVISEWKSRPGFPVRVDGNYDLWAICCWWHEQKRLQALKNQINVPEDLEPAEGDSVWLERYREARTHRENLKLEQERRNLLPRELVHTVLGQIAVLIRGVGERLQRNFGPDAALVLDTALIEAEALIEQVFGPEDDDIDGDNAADETAIAGTPGGASIIRLELQDAPSPDDAAVRGRGNHRPDRPV